MSIQKYFVGKVRKKYNEKKLEREEKKCEERKRMASSIKFEDEKRMKVKAKSSP